MKTVKESMPEVAEFIDALRDAFGKDFIDKSIRQGLKDGTFFAHENGYFVGNVELKK